ncbi:D-2-hydroxyacid dehydrogenase [Iodobacter fluviatilis]|uniref:Glycerate dehydrogenase n=1 Tax=Iodobacter fluviatilis TaxID=537 RepID=A0A377QAP6_9NEIS|nr:D-2-hydroxyacid dehydrogenase [Iodobacter fluviatilis]TCU83707.1 glycerate dehydrogenase [Iodobacter fluviatilis]STQ91785.1 Glycerate dehydrogenase [Iodobacter fluviatilis]
MLPRIVFLDRDSLPLTLLPLKAPHQWQEYANTSADEVAERLINADIAISNKVPLSAATIAACPNLKLIAVAATGYNQIDLAACKARGIRVCNIRDYALAGVPEHALMLMLALRRQLLAYRADVEAGQWQQAKSFCHFAVPIHDLAGSTLTLIGSGALGQAMAGLARALGMNVLFAERKHAETVRQGYVDFNEALSRADVLSLHCPLNEQTRNLIGAAELALMKKDAVLINTARGGLVDEVALLHALQTGQLGGAGLDVLITEPPKDGNALLDVSLPNLIITPHIAWAGQFTMQQLADQLIHNIDAFLVGSPRNVLI